MAQCIVDALALQGKGRFTKLKCALFLSDEAKAANQKRLEAEAARVKLEEDLRAQAIERQKAQEAADIQAEMDKLEAEARRQATREWMHERRRKEELKLEEKRKKEKQKSPPPQSEERSLNIDFLRSNVLQKGNFGFEKSIWRDHHESILKTILKTKQTFQVACFYL